MEEAAGEHDRFQRVERPLRGRSSPCDRFARRRDALGSSRPILLDRLSTSLLEEAPESMKEEAVCGSSSWLHALLWNVTRRRSPLTAAWKGSVRSLLLLAEKRRGMVFTGLRGAQHITASAQPYRTRHRFAMAGIPTGLCEIQKSSARSDIQPVWRDRFS